MSEPPPSTDAQAIIAAIQALCVPSVLKVERGNMMGAGVVLIPQGMKPFNVKSLLDEFLPAPERRKGSAALESVDAFIAHAKRFSDADSVVFANPDPTSPSLTSVLDYHRAGADGSPRFGQHRGVYRFPLSAEWQAWNANNNKAMSQVNFAAFLEDRISDIADPKGANASALAFVHSLLVEFASPQRLLDLSRGLQITVESKVGAHVSLSSGEGQITFTEAHADATGKPIKIPGAFLIQIPVFRGDALYQIGARLRYRISEGKVVWSYVLYRTDRVFDDAVKVACDVVAKGTGLPVLMGSPE